MKRFEGEGGVNEEKEGERNLFPPTLFPQVTSVQGGEREVSREGATLRGNDARFRNFNRPRATSVNIRERERETHLYSLHPLLNSSESLSSFLRL